MANPTEREVSCQLTKAVTAPLVQLSLAPPSFLRNPFLQPSLSPLLCCLVTANLIGRLRLERRHRHRPSIPIDRDERQVARVRVASKSGEKIFGLDAHADLHRRPADIVDARLHDDEIAYWGLLG